MPQNTQSDWNESYPDEGTLGRSPSGPDLDDDDGPDDDDDDDDGPWPGANNPAEDSWPSVPRSGEDDPYGQQ